MTQEFKKWNNILGWVVFAIALFTYTKTVEPTASFWDCGEYIATSVKLQVGHPPGAPMFQLVGNVLSQLAFGNVMMQAFWVNMLSVFSSAFTILFLFWTITALGRKLAQLNHTLDEGKMWAIMGSGMVGGLAYTFSDSFWFSAVEGEVYAMSSFFTAIAFWAVLKWEEVVDTDKYANRWLVLISLLVGLSVGVHILVFLTIPAIAMIYYFKKFENHTKAGFLIANVVAIGVLGIVFKGIIPLVLNLFGKTEIFFVNTLDLPFNSGTIFVFLMLTALVVWGVMYSKKNRKPLLEQVILSVVFLMIGYSSFIILSIRSNANTPIDENNPEDALSLLAYYDREQYGDWPVLYGKYFNAPYDQRNPFSDGKPVYIRGYAVLEGNREIRQFREKWEAENFINEQGKPGSTYEIDGRYIMTDDRKQSKPNFDPAYVGLFPRMWSDDPGHVRNYVKIAGLRNENQKPSLADNIRFFMDYQLGHMYFRYFMWNFSGKQNDEQGRYELTKGNWITGIKPLDAIRLGPQENLPSTITENPGYNRYYLLPFILGLIGLYFHFARNWKDAWAVLLFFLFTGVAIVLYTNHKPFEPRERDYAFVGSFYVYSIWIGLGVMAIYEFLKKNMQNTKTALAITLVCLVAVPGLMAKENWDDHDRSGRYTARDVAKAYLDSCAPNAILFTNGDNDTFPLWYVQEIEGYRTDVRVVNLSLLNTDWYIDQQRRKAYDGEPVPFTFEWDQYKQGTRDVIYYQQMDRVRGRWMAKDFIDFVKRDDDLNKARGQGGRTFMVFPNKKLRIPINRDEVIKNNVVPEEDYDRILNHIDWDIEQNHLTKRDLMVVDLIAHNNWERPIYFAVTVGGSSKAFFWLDDYFRLEGLTYRFVPVKNQDPISQVDFGEVNTDILYDNFMNKFEWETMINLDTYMDETNRRPIVNLRNIAGRLAGKLADEGKTDKAIEVCDLAMAKMPGDKFGYNYFLMGIIESYFKAGAKDKGMDIIFDYADMLEEELNYFDLFRGKRRTDLQNQIQSNLQLHGMLSQIERQYNKDSDQMQQRFNQIRQRFGV